MVFTKMCHNSDSIFYNIDPPPHKPAS
jgi:hypothetical protein